MLGQSENFRKLHTLKIFVLLQGLGLAEIVALPSSKKSKLSAGEPVCPSGGLLVCGSLCLSLEKHFLLYFWFKWTLSDWCLGVISCTVVYKQLTL